MDRNYSLDVNDLNAVFIILTLGVFILALIAMVFLICRVNLCKKSSSRRNPRRTSQIPHVLITQHSSDKSPISLDGNDIDFIDSKTTNLVSSTRQIDSVHQKNLNM